MAKNNHATSSYELFKLSENSCALLGQSDWEIVPFCHFLLKILAKN